LVLEKLTQQNFPHEQVLFREACEDDYGLIIQSWLLSYQASHGTRDVPNDVYFAQQHKIIESCIHSGNALVLAPLSEPRVIMGFIVFSLEPQGLVMDWLGVKKTFRRMGICNFIMNNIIDFHPDSEQIYCTHWPASMFEVTVKRQMHRHKIRYNPYLQQRFL
jgi:hypothetical protein